MTKVRIRVRPRTIRLTSFSNRKGEVTVRRIASLCALTAFLVVVVASPAWAHVSIDPSSAPKGSDAVLAFTVPNEQETATTTRLVVQFPHDHPIAEALVQPVAGWSAAVKSFHTTKPIQTDSGPVNDAVDTVTWTATGAGIAVGDFQQFKVSVGLPDDADSLLFPTIQTYTCLPGESCTASDLTVQWVEQTVAGAPEPDHPVPSLTLTAAEQGGTSTPTTVAPGSGASSLPAGAAKKSDVDTAKTVAIIAVIVGGLGLLVGIGGVAIGRRRA
jgi:periplasmic copper chaperone A